MTQEGSVGGKYLEETDGRETKIYEEIRENQKCRKEEKSMS